MAGVSADIQVELPQKVFLVRVMIPQLVIVQLLWLWHTDGYRLWLCCDCVLCSYGLSTYSLSSYGLSSYGVSSYGLHTCGLLIVMSTMLRASSVDIFFAFLFFIFCCVCVAVVAVWLFMIV